jgi:hypothetical protein
MGSPHLKLALAILTASPSMCLAGQTAEQTVAYLTYGAEDQGERGPVKFAEAPSEVGTEYDLTWPNSKGAHITIMQTSQCAVRINFDNLNSPGEVVSFIDFSSAYAVKESFGSWKIAFGESCAVRIKGECRNTFGNPYGGELERAKNALAYFKENFCRGSGF